MKTTVEVPDKLYRQIKARAALRGQTIKAFFPDALRDKLASDKDLAQDEPGWMTVFGKARKEDMEELIRRIGLDPRHDCRFRALGRRRESCSCAAS